MDRLGIGKRNNHEITRQHGSEPQRKHASSTKRVCHASTAQEEKTAKRGEGANVKSKNLMRERKQQPAHARPYRPDTKFTFY